MKGETISANFWQGKCKFIANFSAIMVTSLPSHYFRLTLSLSLSHRLYLTHNIGSASALPIIRPTSISFLRICHSPATGVVVVACLRGVFFVSSLIAACSSGPFSLRKQFFYASRGFCPNGGKQRCGCSQMRQAGTSCTFDGFRYDGDRGESSAGFVLLKARATNDGGYLLGEDTSDGGAWGEK